MDHEELPDSIPDRPVLLCAEPECDRPPVPGDRRCALHAARLGSLPGRAATPREVPLAVVPDHEIVRTPSRRRVLYQVARPTAWLCAILAPLLHANRSLVGDSDTLLVVFFLLPTCWALLAGSVLTMLATAERLLDPWVLPPLLVSVLASLYLMLAMFR